MSKFHTFYSETTGSGNSILWEVWCSNTPVSLVALVKKSQLPSDIVYRDVMYYINSSLLIPVDIDSDMGVIFNPIIEWAIAVQELVRNYSKEEIEFKRREASAEVEMYEELHNAEDVAEKYEETEDAEDVASWVSAEAEEKWATAALEVYDLLESCFESELSVSQESILSAADAEKEIVERWDNS